MYFWHFSCVYGNTDYRDALNNVTDAEAVAGRLTGIADSMFKMEYWEAFVPNLSTVYCAKTRTIAC